MIPMLRKSLVLVLVSAASLLAVLMIQRARHTPPAKPAITVFCAAGLKQPVEAVARQFLDELGIAVNLQYGGTGTLLSQLQVAKQGDLFIAADDGSLTDAHGRKLIRETLPLVEQRPVLAVQSGNPQGLHALDDLARNDVRLALANPDCASISKVTRRMLGAKWDTLAAKAVMMKPSVTEIAADLQLGAVNAAIVWNSTVPQFKGIEAVELPELSGHRENATAAVLATCDQPKQALMFARYLAAPDRGGKTFQQHGFQPAGGDKWVVKPELVLYSGGVNRLAIEKLIQQFSEREGANVTTVFNGCGVLCAAMKSMNDPSNPKFPDAYYACDVCFVPPVAQHFQEVSLLTETEIVIATPKGNPKHVTNLADLAQPGLRVGLCNAEQSTLGYMTAAMLRESNLLENVRKNVVVEVPTADFLINQMRAGSLDAVVVYQVNVRAQTAHLDAIKLPADKAKAVQPFAVRDDSPNRRLSQRLLAFLKDHRETFEAAGFVWRGNEAPVPTNKLEIPEWLQQR